MSSESNVFARFAQWLTGHRVAARFVSAEFEERYAKLLLAMSTEEAKVILGFPPHSNPSEEEIAKSYKKKVVENHPDRGGDHNKMVEVNVAKDVLDGKQRPTMQRGAPPYTRPDWSTPPKREKPKVVDTDKGVPFSTASSKAPGGVEWKFIGKPTYASGKNSAYNHYITCVVGQTATHWVVAGIAHRMPNSFMNFDKGGTVEIEDSWEFDVKETERSKDPLKVLPMLIKAATGMFSDGIIPETPKKFVAWPGGNLSEGAIKSVKAGSGGASLKDILVGTGMVSTEHKGVAGRKSVVEMWTKYSLERKKRMTEKKGPMKVYSVDVYDFFVRVNGHEFKLEDETIHNLDKNGILGAIFKHDFTESGPKQLNRLRGSMFGAGPALAITKLSEALTGEPTALHSALQKAAEEWAEPEDKTASILVWRV